MIEERVVEEVRSLGRRMREIMAAFSFGRNHESLGREIVILADQAVELTGYHDFIFEKANVIRSHVSYFGRPRKHRTAIKEILDPIGDLEKWNPDLK
jgi:hypothetical protein